MATQNISQRYYLFCLLLLLAISAAFIAIVVVRPRVHVSNETTFLGPTESIYYLIVKHAPLSEIREEVSSDPSIVLQTIRPPGDSLLAIAAGEGSVEVVDMLLAMGANPNGNAGDRYVPLYRAITSRQPSEKVVRMLLEAGADPDMPIGDRETATVLDFADVVNNHAIVTALRQQRAVQND